MKRAAHYICTLHGHGEYSNFWDCLYGVCFFVLEITVFIGCIVVKEVIFCLYHKLLRVYSRIHIPLVVYLGGEAIEGGVDYRIGITIFKSYVVPVSSPVIELQVSRLKGISAASSRR
jgi:hypothetical protein